MREDMNSGNLVNKLYGSGVYTQFSDTILRPLIKSPARSSALVFFFLSLFVGAFLSTRFLDSSPIVDSSIRKTVLTAKTIDTHPDNKTTQSPPKARKKIVIPFNSSKPIDTHPDNDTMQSPPKARKKIVIPLNGSKPIDTHPDNKTTQSPPKADKKIVIPLNCSVGNIRQTCPINYPYKLELDPDTQAPSTCPEYFRWIYEDLRPWRETGITREMVERARKTANFRLVILNGRAYVERYQKSFQSRDVFTLWGILQLLRKYPGRVPDLELMFDCVDWPVVISRYYRGRNANAPPPLFRYCGDDRTLDIVFPDWSFWGWSEVNIKPWQSLSKELKEGNKKMRFMEREPCAYWKGNPFVASTRMDLLKCNFSNKQNWHAQIYIQDWVKESQQGFKQSNLASQCIHRYKIYIEGSAWSVSEKYILACDSVTLIVKPRYYDFFSRSLMPTHHYWPIKEDDKCRSIKFAVEWGNRHKQKAQAIGKAASDFIQEDLKMDYVYDYMLHLLTEYAKLLKFKPSKPQNAVELCSEIMACHSVGLEKEFMMESMVNGPSGTGPCAMPPYDRVALQAFLRRKTNAVRQIEKWEKDYWDNQTMLH